MKKRSLLVIGMLFVLFMPVVIKAAEETENTARLKALGKACLFYMKVHGDKAPPSLSTLYYEGYVDDVKYFASPVNPKGVLERVKIDELSDYVLSYQRHSLSIGSETGVEDPSSIPTPRIDPQGPPQAIIQDRSAVNNGGKGVYVFYSDESIHLKSEEVVSRGFPTVEQPKLERPETEQPTKGRPTTKNPSTERPKAERSLPERPAPEIPVAERPKPDLPKSESPIPDKQTFDDYKEDQLDAYKKWLEQQKGSQ